MQKVEGSSPFIRSQKPRSDGVFCAPPRAILRSANAALPDCPLNPDSPPSPRAHVPKARERRTRDR
jgi:hypothetical protein